MKRLILFIVITSLAACFGRKPEKTGLEGKSMPSFNLLLADSNTRFNTGSIPSGEPVVLFYFGPHCPYSRSQMEEIIEEMSILKNIHFYIFTITPFSEMKDFYNHYQLYKFKNITVGIDSAIFFKSYFEAPGVPYMAIYGKEKKLNKVFMGKIYGRQIRDAAEE